MSIHQPIYLDFAATTPLHPDVLKAMWPWFTEKFGNPSSGHVWGQKAEAEVERSRDVLAAAFQRKPNEVIFTSGGTESDNLALRGVSFAKRAEKGFNHLLISPVEHPGVAKTAEQLRDIFGFDLQYLPVDRMGMVDPDDVKKMIRNDTILVSVIYGNNEIGTINPIGEIGSVCSRAGVPFHTDAVQAAAHLSIDAQKENIGLISVGAHKFFGPKGVGVLIKDSKVLILITQTGGKQENGFRAGTHNVPYIVGMAKAIQLISSYTLSTKAEMTVLRNHLIDSVVSSIPESQLTGHPTNRLPNHASFVFKGVDGNQLLMALDSEGFACSSGSACKVGNPTPSSVLLAMGIPVEWALGSLRVTLGQNTTKEQIDLFLNKLPGVVERIRKRC